MTKNWAHIKKLNIKDSWEYFSQVNKRNLTVIVVKPYCYHSEIDLNVYFVL